MSTKTDPCLRVIYNFIDAFWWERGYAPTQEEIAKGVNLSYDKARTYLRELRDSGVVDWNPKAVRTIRITGALEQLK